MQRLRHRKDSGETLVETVISLMVFGLAGLMVLAGLGAASLLSADHRKLTVADVGLKAAAEGVKQAPYVDGAGDDTYDGAVSAAPTGFQVEVGPVRCWPGGAGTSWSSGGFVPCASTELGLQAVRVVVRSTDGAVAQSTTVMKRRSP